MVAAAVMWLVRDFFETGVLMVAVGCRLSSGNSFSISKRLVFFFRGRPTVFCRLIRSHRAFDFDGCARMCVKFIGS